MSAAARRRRLIEILPPGRTPILAVVLAALLGSLGRLESVATGTSPAPPRPAPDPAAAPA